MATIGEFERNKIKKDNPMFSTLRAIVESTFYQNDVTEVKDLEEAYHLAHDNTHTIVTDMDVKYPEKLGIPSDAKVLVENGGGVVGRTAAARRIVGQSGSADKELLTIVREAVYQGSKKERLKTEAYVGLDGEFMLKAHLSVPKGQENNLYSWLLNFQPRTEEYDRMYAESKQWDEGDLFIYQDPDWSHPDYPKGLAYFDPDHNTAVILGLNYFGELKKGTLTMAWNIAHKNGYVSCHGGQKKFDLENDGTYVAAFFGLSGSGKSTLTHAKHNDKYEKVEVLHDDAFIISLADGSSIALEPSYFDKTQDYPMDHREVDYFLTVQNVGVVRDSDGKKVLLTEDVRNGNGRTIKSRYSTPNRVDRFDESVNAVFWIMKDESMPPILKISDSVLGSAFGATLTTKRTTAEEVSKKHDPNALVIEPYANPFRVYSLADDYTHFKDLLDRPNTECYIINTGKFLHKDITKEVTLASIEAIVDGTAEFKSFHNESISYMVIEGYEPDFEDQSYVNLVNERMNFRMKFIENQNTKGGLNVLPNEAIDALKEVILEH